MRLFALHPADSFGEKVASALGRSLDVLEERTFEDGEHKIRPMVSVRGEDVYVIQALYSDEEQTVNDKLCKFLFFIAALKDNGAKSVTAVVPYMCYARKDRRTKARDPVTTRYVALLFEAVGVNRVITIDVHNLQAFQNAFRCPTEHLEAHILFAEHFKELLQPADKVAVMSPDIGGAKRAERFRQRLSQTLSKEIDLVFMEKTRSKDVVKGETIVGEVHEKNVIILDDMISSGTTMVRAAAACKKHGAAKIYAVATHGAFSAKASKVFQEESLSKIIITNTIRDIKVEEQVRSKIIVLDLVPLFANTIQALYTGGSLVDLMQAE